MRAGSRDQVGLSRLLYIPFTKLHVVLFKHRVFRRFILLFASSLQIDVHEMVITALAASMYCKLGHYRLRETI